jgi:hypothetical protein
MLKYSAVFFLKAPSGNEKIQNLPLIPHFFDYYDFQNIQFAGLNDYEMENFICLAAF